MFDSLPKTIHDTMDWTWENYQPYYDDLVNRDLNANNVDAWMADWTKITEFTWERASRLRVAVTLHTDSEDARAAYDHYLETIMPPAQKAGQALKEKLLASELEPDGMAIPLRDMRVEAEIFREENIPLQIKVTQTSAAYDRIMGAHTIEWEGTEYTMPQLSTFSANPNRAEREAIWRSASSRVLEDRDAINETWVQLIDLRAQMYKNAGFDDYRAYAWKDRGRFAYTPEDCETFHAAIEEVVVPAAKRVYERQLARLGAESVRPWDVNVDPMRTTDMPVDPLNRPALKPFKDDVELVSISAKMFHKTDPALGDYFDRLVGAEMVDLANYKGKAAGAYCTSYPVSRTPFVFMNAVGTQSNVTTMLHEVGHAFHGYETLAALPYLQQRRYPMEFAEVASMSMELLAAPYMHIDEGGFYHDADYARARSEHLERILIFWPYMAVVDGFQHWVYTHMDEARDPANCDAKWGELWDRFIVGVDWSGLEDEKVTGWHRKLHIFRYPFYYVEYGLAQLGAVQVWRNALTDQAQAVADYRKALALGGTVTLPELFEAAGARFGFDAEIMGEAVDLIERTVDELIEQAG